MGGEIHPYEHRLTGLALLLDELNGASRDVIVDGLHALPGQRTGVLDLLVSRQAAPSEWITPLGPTSSGSRGSRIPSGSPGVPVPLLH